MNATKTTLTALLALFGTGLALASEAETSASAGSSRYQRNGTATATAGYTGDIGAARTQTRSGDVNLARGIAWGLDKDGLSLSVSNAVATKRGPAVATSFNLSIGTNGQVSHSTGISVARGPLHRSATAGGKVGTTRRTPAMSFASGKTDRYGTVRAVTRASNHRPRPRLGTEMRRYRRVRR